MLAGNAVYFLLLAPHLPAWGRHRPFACDLGLIVDFVVCLTIFLAVGAIRRPGAGRGL